MLKHVLIELFFLSFWPASTNTTNVLLQVIK